MSNRRSESDAVYVPCLVATILRTAGPVLELGTGVYSTPMLSELCASQGRELWSYETNQASVCLLAGAAAIRQHHRYTSVESYTEAPIEREWGMAFLNHAPAERRAIDLLRIKDHAQVIVVHESEHPAVDAALAHFKYVLKINDLAERNTAIASQTVDVTRWDLWRCKLDDPSERGCELVMASANESVGSRLCLYTASMESINIENQYRGADCFLVLSGPSLHSHDLSLLNERGVVTMGVNNSWSIVRPTLWTSVDSAGSFIDVGWKDPGITKIVPLTDKNQTLRVKLPNGEFRRSKYRVCDMPNVLYFRHNEQFNPETFLTSPTVNWGQHSDTRCVLGIKGCRSVMLVALRLLHYLGFRRVFLLGCDFKMEVGQQNYAFAQERSEASVSGNNSSYRALSRRFDALAPYFRKSGFEVYNCNPDSKLTSFPHMPFAQAVELATRQFRGPIDTAGWYDHQESKHMPTQECNEFENLKRRRYRDYSEGHRRMYVAPVELLMNNESKLPSLRILDVGCGIGYGLALMLSAGIVGEYVGIEPCKEAAEWTRSRYLDPRVKIVQEDWMAAEIPFVADYTFCIEVVEHLLEETVVPFIQKLHQATGKTMFLSTPSSATSNHGTKTPPEWKVILQQCGFDCVFVERQWTTLFICQPR